MITLFYKLGVWPRLTAGPFIAPPCWLGPSPNCSWNPWGTLAPVSPGGNGGVPQAANLSLHLEALAADLEATVPDAAAFSGLLVVDWEVSSAHEPEPFPPCTLCPSACAQMRVLPYLADAQTVLVVTLSHCASRRWGSLGIAGGCAGVAPTCCGKR